MRCVCPSSRHTPHIYLYGFGILQVKYSVDFYMYLPSYCSQLGESDRYWFAPRNYRVKCRTTSLNLLVVRSALAPSKSGNALPESVLHLNWVNVLI